MDAKKEPIERDEAIKLARQASKLLVAKGKKVVELDLKKQEFTDEELEKLVVGPSEKLRAPTLRVGKTLVVGFNDEMYESVFG